MDILQENILPFWQALQQPDGSFVGRVSGKGIVCPDAPKGAILHARILWAFSASYRVLGKVEYLATAKRAYAYFASHFIDKEFGGVYWSLDAEGRPNDEHKQFYALGFAIYALSEYARCLQKAGEAFGEPLSEAVDLYRCIERHSRDSKAGGYFEALSRDWSPITDVRLSAKDMNASKTMNTHLHILEPYANLYKLWPSPELKESIEHLLDVFTGRMIDPATGHIGLFFDNEWRRQDHQISFGHEIEAWWLLAEAAQAIGKADFWQSPAMKALECNCMNFYATHPASEGLPYEIREDGTLDTDRHWWVQAEAVVGFAWIHALTGNERALDYSRAQLGFINNHLLRPSGEWYWSARQLPGGPWQAGMEGTGAEGVSCRQAEQVPGGPWQAGMETTGAEGENCRQAEQVPCGPWQANMEDDIAGFWKCPYHNTRMCLELLNLEIQ